MHFWLFVGVGGRTAGTEAQDTLIHVPLSFWDTLCGVQEPPLKGNRAQQRGAWGSALPFLLGAGVQSSVSTPALCQSFSCVSLVCDPATADNTEA